MRLEADSCVSVSKALENAFGLWAGWALDTIGLEAKGGEEGEVTTFYMGAIFAHFFTHLLRCEPATSPLVAHADGVGGKMECNGGVANDDVEEEGRGVNRVIVVCSIVPNNV
eukprot:SAG31_NODE_4457_length_3215_cov_1.790757_2_plen_112_part_00